VIVRLDRFVSGSANRYTAWPRYHTRSRGQQNRADWDDMTHNVLEELLVSSEVQTARDRLEDFDTAESAADANPQGEQELDDLRHALIEMPGAVRMLLEAIDRAGATAGEPQYDPGDRAGFS
jgi:hypothetical protein